MKRSDSILLPALLTAAAVTLLVSITAVRGFQRTPAAPVPRSLSDCRLCHVCDTPMPGRPCLLECPRVVEMTPPHDAMSAEQSPEVVILAELSEMYVPVIFAHKLHARMSAISGGCTLCHHYTPTERSHPPCRECHDPGVEKGNLRQPGLKGAYHRQCLGCHREWSHTTECAVCHVKKAGGPLAPSVTDQSDIIGVAHPIITKPETRVYHTRFTEGPIVTFHHEEHIELFDLQCVDCHRKEGCTQCHDLGRQGVFRKSLEEHHQPCQACHEDDSCDFCHRTDIRPKFTHADVGWPHNVYHRDLPCRACHPKGRRIGPLSTRCTSCHMNWKPGTFEHQVTGVKIDDCHEGFDCTDCHTGGRFDRRPQCDGCHEDGRRYPESPICRTPRTGTTTRGG
jgi:hypothetical protein